MELERIMTVTVEVEEVLGIGQSPAGELRVVPFGPGTFEGPELRGRTLPGGTDWQRVRSNGTLELRAHYLLETDQGERVEVISEGLRAASPEVLGRLAAGENVPPSDYYFRTGIRLTTAAPRLSHLNDRIYVGSGSRKAREVTVVIYRVP